MSQTNDNGFASFVAGEAISQYARVKLNTSRQVVEADADDKGIGTAVIETASGAHCTVKLWTAPGSHKVVAAGAVSVNDIVYGADEGKVDDVVGTGIAVGRALEAATADGNIIEILPMASEGTGLVYSNVADSAQVENTTTETAFDKSKTIDGATLQVGDVIEVVAQGFVEDNNSTDTLNVKLYFGTEEIVATGAVDSADNDIFTIHAFIFIRTLGASGTIAACGYHSNGVPGTVTAKPFRKAEATEDISGDVAITVKATWSVAHADNECELENLAVILHRQ